MTTSWRFTVVSNLGFDAFQQNWVLNIQDFYVPSPPILTIYSANESEELECIVQPHSKASLFLTPA
jgi:hypothetical protein